MARLMIILVVLHLFSCKRKPADINPEEQYVPREVILKTKNNFTIDKVFEFINSYDHEVELIYHSFYVSSLPTDSLKYVVDYLNKRTYTHENEYWTVSGYIDNQSKLITIFPRMIQMTDRKNQADWLHTLEVLKLTEVTDRTNAGGSIIQFKVPLNDEKEWVNKFKKLDFVEWVELNYYANIVPL